MLSTGDNIRFDRRLLWNIKFGQRSTRHWRLIRCRDIGRWRAFHFPPPDSFSPFFFSFMFRISSKVIVIGGNFQVYMLIRLVCLYIALEIEFHFDFIVPLSLWNEQQTQSALFRANIFFFFRWCGCWCILLLQLMLGHQFICLQTAEQHILTINGHIVTTTNDTCASKLAYDNNYHKKKWF